MMCNTATQWRTLVLGACFAAGMLICSDAVVADHKGKPHGGPGGGNDGGGGGTTAAGEVYFNSAGEAFLMNADGSGKTLTVEGQPSYGVYNGFRWMLSIQPIPGEAYPNGDQRVEIFATRDDGADTIQVTDDPTRQVMQQGSDREVRWAVDEGLVDGKFSFTGRQFDGDGNVIGGGIYSALVMFDELLEPLTSSEALVWEVDLWNIGSANAPDYVPDSRRHSWSPDGELLTLDTISESAIHVADPATGLSYFLTEGVDPNWSPDGSSIAFIHREGALNMYTIDINGANRSLLVEGFENRSSIRGINQPEWSPDSQFLTYKYFVYNNGGDTMDVYIIGRDGSGETNLTNDWSDLAAPAAWR